MARLTDLAYSPGNSMVHELDARFKLASLALVSVACLGAGLPVMILFTFLWVLLLLHMRFTLSILSGTFMPVMLLLLVVLASRALFTPGHALLSYGVITITREGLQQGGLVCWRLVLMLLAGIVLTVTTRSADIRAAVVWYLKPIPWLPAHRIATMMGLTLRFLPLILQQAGESRAARQARCGNLRRNPLIRLRVLTLPLFRRTFLRADELAEAMAARCYTEQRTEPALCAGRKDWICLIVVLHLCAVRILLTR